MKIMSFNINGIRARLHQLELIEALHQPDIIGLQETKVADDQFPLEQVQALGWHVAYHGQKGHYGVALLSRQPPQWVKKGFTTDADDAQRRLISAGYALPNGQNVTVLNGYFPQGESRDHPEKFPNKQRFYADLDRVLGEMNVTDEAIAVIGDMNIAPADNDIGIGADNQKRWLRTGKCSFLPEEREWLARIQAHGFIDTFRHCHPAVADRYSWFDYRSRGFERDPKRGLRIDLILASPKLVGWLAAADIDYEVRGSEKPSDHCPIWAQFEPV